MRALPILILFLALAIAGCDRSDPQGGVALATIDDNPIKPESLRELVELIEAGTIANNQAKEVFSELWDTPEKKPADIAKAMGFEPADNSAIEAIIDEVIAANPEKVAEIQGGNAKAANWFTGQVMKASRGKANPKMVSDYIKVKLDL